MVDSIKIATVNCQGLATLSKRQDVLNFYRSKGYSIICFQDTHFTPEAEPYIEAMWGYKCFFNSYKSNARGVALFFNNNFEFKVHQEKRDKEGNLIALDLTIEDNRVTLINIYGPNIDSPEFYEYVREVFLELDNEYYILLGDFNLALSPDIDTNNYTSINNPKARKKLLEIMDDLQLLDYFRILNPDRRVYTWHKKTPLKQGRLDYILISESLSNSVETYLIKPGYRSDHSIVVVELKFNSFKRGCGLWKFNNSLLSDKEYVQKVKETIHKVCRQYSKSDTDNTRSIDDSILLEVLLMEIRGVTISYSSYKKKQREKQEISLLEEIGHLETEEKIDLHLIEEKRLILENFRKEKMEGHIIRSKARWIEEGENPQGISAIWKNAII